MKVCQDHDFKVSWVGCHQFQRDEFSLELECSNCGKKLMADVIVPKMLSANLKENFMEVTFNSEKGEER